MNTLNGNATINPNVPIKCTKDGLIEQLKKCRQKVGCEKSDAFPEVNMVGMATL